jgi:hypothetical protein
MPSNQAEQSTITQPGNDTITPPDIVIDPGHPGCKTMVYAHIRHCLALPSRSMARRLFFSLTAADDRDRS